MDKQHIVHWMENPGSGLQSSDPVLKCKEGERGLRGSNNPRPISQNPMMKKIYIVCDGGFNQGYEKAATQPDAKNAEKGGVRLGWV